MKRAHIKGRREYHSPITKTEKPQAREAEPETYYVFISRVIGDHCINPPGAMWITIVSQKSQVKEFYDFISVFNI